MTDSKPDQCWEPIALSQQKRAELLEKFLLARGFEWPQIETLASFIETFTIPPQTVLFDQGDRLSFFGFICEGRVSVVRHDHADHQKVIATLGPGNTFGEMSFLDGEPCSATLRSDGVLKIICLSQENFLLLEERAPRLWGKLLLFLGKTLSRRLRITSGVLAEYLNE